MKIGKYALGLFFVQLAGFAIFAGESKPAESCADFTADGAWCWFSDPRAIFRDGKIYAGWMTGDGAVQVGAMDLKTSAIQVMTLAEKFERDDHDNPALLFLPDGRLAAFFSHHAKEDMHLRVTEKPDDIGAWSPDRKLGFGAGGKGVTYANPAMLGDEKNAIYLFWRGSDFKPTLSISKDLCETWSRPQALIRRPSADDTNRPYLKMWTDSRRRIDIVFTDGHPRDEATNSVYFLRYEKGAFFKADGTRIGGMDDLPLDPAKCDRVYDGSTAGRAWIWDIAEQGGNPVVAYTRLPDETDHRYRYARWDGKQWLDFEITPAGKWFPHTAPGAKEREPHYSGGMALDRENADTVFLSRPVNGVFEIEKWRTPDGGATWKSEAVTANSKADNVRPFVIRNAPAGAPCLLWMNISDHYVHFTDFKTSIKINAPSDGASAQKFSPLSDAIEPAAVLAAMERAADWQLANPSRQQPTDWVPASGYPGMMALADISKNPKYHDAMMQMGGDAQWKLGPRKFHADDHVVGQTYAELYLCHHDARMIEPMRKQFDEILAEPRDGDLEFEKKGAQEKWSWCDSLFMAPPAWLRLWAETGDARYLDFAVTNWWKTSDYLYDRDEHLFFRDSTYFAKREANGKKVCWSRGNGWVMAGLVRMLQYLPKDHPARPRFVQQFREMAEKIFALQQPDGLWHSSLLDPKSYPIKETSGSGFYCYAFAWGVNEGLLDRAKFEPRAVKAWKSLVSCVAPNGMLTHVQPIGADPKLFDENHNEPFGTGAFLLAGSEIYRMAQKL
jgi:rhamnogalacturonyl hydrolase YesR